jgi:hypothetical protein
LCRLFDEVIHDLWRDFHRLDSAFWIKAAIAAAETEHGAHAVAVIQLEKETE